MMGNTARFGSIFDWLKYDLVRSTDLVVARGLIPTILLQIPSKIFKTMKMSNIILTTTIVTGALALESNQSEAQ